ncbi:MAG TPA: hypothetical protein VFK04_08260 [Gemmatimonadaceae bacterium]|nr:hypothetical protein [Gemmatimonadaceae bacterium]
MSTSAAASTDQSSMATPAARIAPSIPALFFVFLALIVPLFAQHHLINGDGDVARHIRHGLYMLQHRTLIWNDPFSFTRPGEPFIPFEYGSQLLYALVFDLGGLAGVSVLAGVLIGAAYALLARFLLRRGVDPLLAALITASAAVLGFSHWIARPHLFSWVAIVLLLGLVDARRRPRIWVYPLLFALWANIHGAWLYGIAILGIYLVGHAIEYRWFGRSVEERAAVRHFALVLPLACMATLATPMGVRVWTHLYAHLGDNYVLDHTMEFRSPDFHSLVAKILLLVLLGSLAALIMSSRRMHFARLLVVIAGFWWALISERNIPLFGITGLAVVALHLDFEWRALPSRWLARRRAGFAAGALQSATAGWVLLCCFVLSLVAVGHGRLLGRQLVADDFDDSVFPVAAVRAARVANLEGRIFADFTWGGYVLFAWPEQRVFIDGGTDFYGSAIMRDYDRISQLEPDWRDILERWRVDAVLTDSHSKLASEIARTPGWALWYCDSVAVIARRDASATGGYPYRRESELKACAGPSAERR